MIINLVKNNKVIQQEMPPPLLISGKGKGHNFKNLNGQIINNIKLLYPVDKSNDGHVLYLAQCFCGNYFITRLQRLKSGNTKSCGCYKKIKTIERNHQNTEKIIGTFCGNLEVLDFSEYREYNGFRKAFYKCFCHNCGNISYHAGSDLKNGSIQSCGCINSRKEQEIKKILTELNISYFSQYTFPDLINPETNCKLRFDFAIFKNNELFCLIEYQGQQHYNFNDPWHTKQLEKSDSLKREYCLRHNLYLLELNKDNDIKMAIKKLAQQLEGD